MPKIFLWCRVLLDQNCGVKSLWSCSLCSKDYKALLPALDPYCHPLNLHYYELSPFWILILSFFHTFWEPHGPPWNDHFCTDLSHVFPQRAPHLSTHIVKVVHKNGLRSLSQLLNPLDQQVLSESSPWHLLNNSSPRDYPHSQICITTRTIACNLHRSLPITFLPTLPQWTCSSPLNSPISANVAQHNKAGVLPSIQT